MSTIYYDPDEWETVVHGNGYTQHRRSPEDVARIKAKFQREYEDSILAAADEIRARRAGEEQSGGGIGPF